MKNPIRRAIYSYTGIVLEKFMPFSFPIMMIMAAYADYRGWNADDVT